MFFFLIFILFSCLFLSINLLLPIKLFSCSILEVVCMRIIMIKTLHAIKINLHESACACERTGDGIWMYWSCGNPLCLPRIANKRYILEERIATIRLFWASRRNLSWEAANERSRSLTHLQATRTRNYSVLWPVQFPDVPISWGCNSLTKNVVWFEDFLRGYGDATPAYINSQDWMVKRYNSGLEKGQILIGSNVLVSKKNMWFWVEEPKSRV